MIKSEKARRYTGIADVHLYDHVKVVGDAGEYQVIGLNGLFDLLMLSGGARNQEWVKLERLRLIKRHEEFIPWFKDTKKANIEDEVIELLNI